MPINIMLPADQPLTPWLTSGVARISAGPGSLLAAYQGMLKQYAPWLAEDKTPRMDFASINQLFATKP